MPFGPKRVIIRVLFQYYLNKNMACLFKRIIGWFSGYFSVLFTLCLMFLSEYFFSVSKTSCSLQQTNAWSEAKTPPSSPNQAQAFIFTSWCWQVMTLLQKILWNFLLILLNFLVLNSCCRLLNTTQDFSTHYCHHQRMDVNRR